MLRWEESPMKSYLIAYWSFLSWPVRWLLILSPLVVFLWLRSYSSFVFLGMTMRDGLETLFVHDGRIIWKHRSTAGADYINASGPTSGFMLLGLGVERTPALGTEHLWTIEFPFWLLAATVSMAPIIRFLEFRKHQLVLDRIQRGLCVACGYDLRGSSEKCPECGTPITAPNPSPKANV